MKKKDIERLKKRNKVLRNQLRIKQDEFNLREEFDFLMEQNQALIKYLFSLVESLERNQKPEVTNGNFETRV